MTRRLRVVQAIATLGLGGAERQLVHLARRLDPARFDCRVLALQAGGPLEAELVEAGVPFEILGKRAGFDPAFIARSSARLRALAPDLLHCWLFTANAFGHVAGRLAGVPRLVASERGIEEGKGLLHALGDRLVARLSDCIVSNSESGRRLVVETWGADEERTLVIPNGVDLARFRPVDRAARTGPLRLVLLGRLRRQKRVDVFLDALELLRARRVPVVAHIRGEGPLEAELRSRLQGLAELSPPEGDVAPLLEEADVLVSSSDWEGLPNVVLEAMASGLPVVGTRVRGTVEVIRHGVTGLLVDPADPAALADAIERLAGDPELRLQLGAEARRDTEERWSLEAMVARHAELYERLTRQSRTGGAPPSPTRLGGERPR